MLHASTLRRLGANVMLCAALLTAAPAALAATTNANVSIDADLTQVQAEAAAEAKAAANNPELRLATTSLWHDAWIASWPFIKNAVHKFFGLFGDAWHVLISHDKTSADVNTNAAVNVSP